MNRRIAITKVTKEVIEKALSHGLGAPHYWVVPEHNLKDIEILRVDDAELKTEFGTVALTITSPDLPEVEVGEMIPVIHLEYRKVYAERAEI